ncbi:MAG: hypothetical protein ACYTF1_05835, partial [Planctomycetota bacterium]
MSKIDEKEILNRLKAISKFEISPEVADLDLHLVRQKLTKRPENNLRGQHIWRIIMNSRITRLAAAAVIIIAVLIGFTRFGNGGLAFAEVLEQIRSYSYKFDLTIGDQSTQTIKAMVLEAGRTRMEAPVGLGKISYIYDATQDKTLILFHQFKAAVRKIPTTGEYAEAGLLFSLCTSPIENLWNLRDGTEEELGEKQIEGLTAKGFKVTQEDQLYSYDLIIWANVKTGAPVLVKISAKSLEEPSKSVTFVMNNFDLDVELDESLFSLDLPSGYVLTNQKSLDELSLGPDRTSAGETIEQILAYWSQGDKERAVELLLEIDWS